MALATSVYHCMYVCWSESACLFVSMSLFRFVFHSLFYGQIVFVLQLSNINRKNYRDSRIERQNCWLVPLFRCLNTYLSSTMLLNLRHLILSQSFPLNSMRDVNMLIWITVLISTLSFTNKESLDLIIYIIDG